METTTFGIITGVILALAAVLAFLIQRARYLREIEPDLELRWPASIRVNDLHHTLKEFWSLYIDIEVENRSNNHADDLKCEVELEIFPQRGHSTFVPARIPQFPRLHQKELLAGRSVVIPVYIGWNWAKGLYEKLQKWPDPFEVEEVGFEASITVEYSTKRELLMFALVPWHLGKKKCVRTIRGSWGFVTDQNVSPPYVSRRWQFPDQSLCIEEAAQNGEPAKAHPPRKPKAGLQTYHQ